MHERVTRLRALLRERDLPALLVSAPSNRRYLSGFRGSAGMLLVSESAAMLFTDGRYLIQSAREAPDFALSELVNPGRSLGDALAEAAGMLGLRRIGVEASNLSLAEYRRIEAALDGVELVAGEGLVERLREVKDGAEIAILRRAIAITDQAITAVLPQLRPEMSERQAAWMLEVAMRERGAEAPSFPIIVAAGPNAALPHARPGDDLLGEGLPIVIDMGARVDGYHADLTRTVTIGAPAARFREIYAIVLAAQQQALAGLRPGLACSDADALARDHITAAGYGAAFGHGLGHGVGLDIHEGPGLRRVAEGKQSPVLHAGMVTSVEPGIYLEGWGGVRIEDLALITADGAEQLSQAPKQVVTG
ncbi:MAG: aminopeptidase P family protein [Oscillochloris sp.]|nr:aminopeptidase P family protein [Oscillochloris sp.]